MLLTCNTAIHACSDYQEHIVTRTLSSAKKRMYLADIERYKQRAIICLQEAQYKSYLIPDMDAQETINNMIRASVGALFIRGNLRRAAALVTVLLGELAVGYYKTFNEINEKVREAEYCIEVMESLENEMLRLEQSPVYLE